MIKKLLIIIHLLIMFCSCDAPPKAPEPLSLAPTIPIHVGYRDNSISILDSSHKVAKDEDFDDKGNFREKISFRNIDFLDGMSILELPIRLDTVVNEILINILVNGEKVLVNKSIGKNTNEVNFGITKDNIEFDLSNLTNKDVLSVQVHVASNNSVGERTLNFKFEPHFSGTLQIEVLNVERYIVTGSPYLTWDTAEIFLKCFYPNGCDLPDHCAINIVNKYYPYRIPKIRTTSCSEHGGTCIDNINKQRLYEGPDCRQNECPIVFHACNQVENSIIKTNTIKVNNLKKEELTAIEIPKIAPVSGGSVFVTDAKVAPDQYLVKYLGWQLKLNEEKIEVFIK